MSAVHKGKDECYEECTHLRLVASGNHDLRAFSEQLLRDLGGV